MPGIDGITLLKQWNETNQMNVPVIMISGHGTVETAVEATRLGAYDFIEKPLSLAKLILTVKHALENTSLQRENIRLKGYNQHIDTPIGKSKIMQNLREQISQIVEHSTPVLITGESGTDKERFARYLHNQSSRSEEAFVSVGISALSAISLRNRVPPSACSKKPVLSLSVSSLPKNSVRKLSTDKADIPTLINASSDLEL